MRSALLIGKRASVLLATAMACTRPARSRSPAQRPATACTVPPAQTWEQTQQFVRALPAAELLELRCWRVACQCVCEDEDCPCETLSCFKAGRFSIHLWADHSTENKARVKAARAELKRRSLCHCCGGKLVPIGDARANGACHRDWPSRRYHKKSWLARCAGILARTVVHPRRTWSGDAALAHVPHGLAHRVRSARQQNPALDIEKGLRASAFVAKEKCRRQRKGLRAIHGCSTFGVFPKDAVKVLPRKRRRRG